MPQRARMPVTHAARRHATSAPLKASTRGILDTTMRAWRLLGMGRTPAPP